MQGSRWLNGLRYTMLNCPSKWISTLVCVQTPHYTAEADRRASSHPCTYLCDMQIIKKKNSYAPIFRFYLPFFQIRFTVLAQVPPLLFSLKCYFHLSLDIERSFTVIFGKFTNIAFWVSVIRCL